MILTSAVLMLSAAEAWALPTCIGDQNKWSNCYGTRIEEFGTYVGEWRNGQRIGYGTFSWFNGGKYIGEWLDDMHDGQGELTSSDGGGYIGEWKYGKLHGQGILTRPDGTVLEGIFKYGTFKYAQKTPYSSKPSVLEVAFTKLSQSQRRQIQSNLSKLSLYLFRVDGVYGKATAAALVSYNKKYLNNSDLTKDANVVNLMYSALSFEDDKPEPPAETDLKPQEDQVLEASSGSGFAVSSDGYVITNNHVIEGCQEVAVYEGGRAVPATVVTYDLQNDLALLKGDFTPKTVFALSGEQPELLQDVYVAGYPFGNEISSSIKVTKGIISSLTGIGNNFSNIQIDAALQVGNSGGPILDEWGNVVGVAVSKLDAKYMYDNFGTIPENTNFGIKANVVRNVLDSNGVSSPSPSTNEITKSELGTRITGGTYYVSCLMTLAQIEVLRTKKVMFENLD